MKKAVVFFADGFEEVEALSPVDYLRRAGVEVTMVSIGNGSRSVTGAHKITVTADISLDSYLSSGQELPDAVVIPGGMPGASNIASCRQALSFIEQMYSNKKLVAAICASPAVVLGQTCVLKGKKWTCYPGMSEIAKDYTQGHVDNVPFVEDGNLITGRGPGAAEEFSMVIVKYLVGQETYESVKKASCQR